MASKSTVYKFYAQITLESGKKRHLFTNDTVARTKVLQKNGINMDAVTWTPIEPARTKEQFLSGADVTVAPEVATESKEAVA